MDSSKEVRDAAEAIEPPLILTCVHNVLHSYVKLSINLTSNNCENVFFLFVYISYSTKE